jgi:hypothetical protein
MPPAAGALRQVSVANHGKVFMQRDRQRVFESLLEQDIRRRTFCFRETENMSISSSVFKDTCLELQLHIVRQSPLQLELQVSQVVLQ